MSAAVTEEERTALKQVFEKVEHLHKALDPEDTPFKSKYEGRQLLVAEFQRYTQRLQEYLSKQSGSEAKAGSNNNNAEYSPFTTPVDYLAVQPDDSNRALLDALGMIEHQLGWNYMDSEELSAGEAKLEKAVSLLSYNPIKYAAELIHSYNQLGTLMCDRSVNDKALGKLELAVQVFDQYSAHRKNESAARTSDQELHTRQVESLYTHTLFYLAQVYGCMGDANQSAQFCQLTLNRQLESKEYSPKEWAENCIGLAAFYLNTANFSQAHHVLQAADKVLPRPDPAFASESDNQLINNLLHSWGGYYAARLTASARAHYERQYAEKKIDSTPPAPLPPPKTADDYNPPLKPFAALQLPLPPRCELAINFDQARDLFMSGLQPLTKALSFFILDGFVSDHIHIQQQISNLYKQLAMFETDNSRKCKMHKRRIDALQPIIDQISPAAYSDLFQQLTDEVARTYAEMVDLKLAIHKQENALDTPANVDKVNALCLQGIKYHTLFLATFDKNKDKTSAAKAAAVAPQIDPAYHSAYLTAKFTLARMYSRVYHTDISKLLHFQQLSLNEYKQILEFADAQKGGVKEFDGELRYCREMVQLLQKKMQAIAADGKPLR